MKKHQIFYLAGALILSGGIFASCGEKKAANENASETEQLDQEAVKESFTPGEKTEALNQLEQIDEMVEAVETPITAKGINGTRYDAAFFNNPANKGDKASLEKYTQTSTGLKYVVLEPGKGKSPKATDSVTVHYVGTLTNGEQFDSSLDRGEPATFPLNRVIPGWTEGLQLMKEGGIAIFYLPSDIAYGEQGSYNPYTGQYTIPPSAPLLFWVQLLEVN